MKVLAISASPREGGNSELLCDQFLKGAERAGHDTEKISLGSMRLLACVGCETCSDSGRCVQQDGMDSVLKKLVDAQVIVLASPVYFYSMNAQMKIFIDRCLPRYKEIRDKDFYIMLTAADQNPKALEPALGGIRGYLSCLPNAKEQEVFFGTGVWKKGDILSHPVMEQAYETGLNL